VSLIVYDKARFAALCWRAIIAVPENARFAGLFPLGRERPTGIVFSKEHGATRLFNPALESELA